MKPIFADTGFWIALLYPSDRWNTQATAIYQEIQHKKQKVMTSEMVLTELLNFFAKFDTLARNLFAGGVNAKQCPNDTIAPEDMKTL